MTKPLVVAIDGEDGRERVCAGAGERGGCGGRGTAAEAGRDGLYGEWSEYSFAWPVE